MPTPGATSGAVNDKINGSFTDNGDGTYNRRVVMAAQASQWASVSTSGTSAAAPAAGTTIASATATAAGYYQVDVVYGYGGTAEPTTADNFGLYDNTTLLWHLSAPASGANTLFPKQTFMLNLNASDVVAVKNVAAGGSGSVYKASVTLTRAA